LSFQENCRYAKDLSQKEGRLRKNVDDLHNQVLYLCRAFFVEANDRTKTSCSYLNNLNRTLRILEGLFGIEN